MKASLFFLVLGAIGYMIWALCEAFEYIGRGEMQKEFQDRLNKESDEQAAWDLERKVDSLEKKIEEEK